MGVEEREGLAKGGAEPAQQPGRPPRDSGRYSSPLKASVLADQMRGSTKCATEPSKARDRTSSNLWSLSILRLVAVALVLCGRQNAFTLFPFIRSLHCPKEALP